MNLNQKQELKQKMERTQELLSCLDSDLIYETSHFTTNALANMIVGNMHHITQGDNLMTLNLLLRCVKKVVNDIKSECE